MPAAAARLLTTAASQGIGVKACSRSWHAQELLLLQEIPKILQSHHLHRGLPPSASLHCSRHLKRKEDGGVNGWALMRMLRAACCSEITPSFPLLSQKERIEGAEHLAAASQGDIRLLTFLVLSSSCCKDGRSRRPAPTNTASRGHRDPEHRPWCQAEP